MKIFYSNYFSCSLSVDLEPIFQFLDDDDSNCICASELAALTTIGDADGERQNEISELNRCLKWNVTNHIDSILSFVYTN